MSFQIGPWQIPAQAVLAPMAGVTDRPFRILCRRFGAGLAASEMITSDQRLWHTAKTRSRMNHEGEPEPRVVQLAGNDPAQLAEAARANVDLGAQIIDINLGCPAKKVYGKLCGSALLGDPQLVGRILKAVVDAVDIPVTVKIRTGIDREHINAVEISRVATDAGVCAIAVHGRTRADFYEGEAEYQTIREIAAQARIPVIANGDIDSPQKAARVLEKTGADGIMIGRAAQGRPWIFRDIAHYLAHGTPAAPPSLDEIRAVLCAHVAELHAFYGEFSGLRVARKHVSWYTGSLAGGTAFRHTFNKLESARAQLDHLEGYFDRLEREACPYTDDAREELAA